MWPNRARRTVAPSRIMERSPVTRFVENEEFEDTRAAVLAVLSMHREELTRILDEGPQSAHDRELVRNCVAFVLEELEHCSALQVTNRLSGGLSLP